MTSHLQSAAGELDAARGSPVGSVECGHPSGVHQLVGDLGAPTGYVECGQGVGALQQGGSKPAVGLADVGQLAAGRRVLAPEHGPADPVRDEGDACRAGDSGLACLERVGVERARPTEAEQVALDRQGEPDRVAAQVAYVEQGVDERRSGAVTIRVAHLVQGVTTGHRVQEQVGDHQPAQPRGAPPGQARGIGKARHGGRGYRRRGLGPSLG